MELVLALWNLLQKRMERTHEQQREGKEKMTEAAWHLVYPLMRN